jgi:hypothetical protein
MHLFRQILLVASFTSLANAEDYGLDCSFPIHNVESSCGDLLGDRQAVYYKYLARKELIAAMPAKGIVLR